MTDRHTADTINDNDLDQLYDDLARTKAQLSDMTRDRDRQAWYVAENDRKRKIQRQRADRTEAALDRVRALRDDLRSTTGARYIADMLDNILNPPGPAATEPDPAVVQEAVKQMDADPHGLEAGMIVKAYRDHGVEKWVFRCWGTDTCDGYLSLDHTSQQSAERARDRHAAEDHPPTPVPCPACARAGQAGLAPTEQHPDCRTQEQP
jgi:hypothetical protein